MSQKTVLFDLHEQSGARIVDFHGWLLPVQYQGILAEHKACRESAAVFDTCHMAQFAISGPGAAAALERLLTQRASALKVGRCKYGLLLQGDGGILDDTVLMRLGEEDFLLVANAGTRQSNFDYLQANLPGEVSLVDNTTQWGKVDIQGPAAYEVLSSLFEGECPKLGYFGATRTEILGSPCILSRTGYTGELGFELYAPCEATRDQFSRFLEHPLVSPAGLGARDLLRLEMGYLLYGQDISTEINPLEADLSFFFNIEDDFVGAEALRRASQNGLARKLVAFRGEGRRRAETGQRILSEGKQVGEVTSSLFSPSVGVMVGMGYVVPDFATVGTSLTIAHPRTELAITLSDTPFYEGATCRDLNAWEKNKNQ